MHVACGLMRNFSGCDLVTELRIPAQSCRRGDLASSRRFRHLWTRGSYAGNSTK
jgi:hypothetical protein